MSIDEPLTCILCGRVQYYSLLDGVVLCSACDSPTPGMVLISMRLIKAGK